MITRTPGVHLRQSLSRSVASVRYNHSKAGPSKPAARSLRAHKSEDYDLIPEVEDVLSFAGLGLGGDTRARSDGRARKTLSHKRSNEEPLERIQPHLKYNHYAEAYEVDDKDLDGDLVVEASNPGERGTSLFEQAIELVKGLPSDSEPTAINDVRTPTDRRINLYRRNTDCIEQSSPTTLYIQQGGLRYRSEQTKHLPHITITYHRLRDGCPCRKCIDPSTRQRTHTSPEAYHEVENSPFVKGEIDDTMIRKAAKNGEEGLRIKWSSDHSAFYPLSRIAYLATGYNPADRTASITERVFWADRDQLLAQQESLFVRYDDLANPETRDTNLLKLLTQVQSFGIVVVKGVPTANTGNDDCTLREVMGWIGEIRNTFYGETWNVRNVANSKNVAYTNLNLGMHMDLLYFSSPPRFQALHCLRNRVEGGSSYFVDSFAAAKEFLTMGYETVPIDFEYDNDSHQLRHRQTLIQGGHFQRLKSAVNWSPPFQGPPVPQTTGNSPAQQKNWYTQLAAFQQIIEQPERKWEFLMEEGDLVLFDNRRVLHARRAFRDLTEDERAERNVEVVEGEPSRWLKGCYLDGEVIWDKLATLSRKLKGQYEG